MHDEGDPPGLGQGHESGGARHSQLPHRERQEKAGIPDTNNNF